MDFVLVNIPSWLKQQLLKWLFFHYGTHWYNFKDRAHILLTFTVQTQYAFTRNLFHYMFFPELWFVQRKIYCLYKSHNMFRCYQRRYSLKGKYFEMVSCYVVLVDCLQTLVGSLVLSHIHSNSSFFQSRVLGLHTLIVIPD